MLPNVNKFHLWAQTTDCYPWRQDFFPCLSLLCRYMIILWNKKSVSFIDILMSSVSRGLACRVLYTATSSYSTSSIAIPLMSRHSILRDLYPCTDFSRLNKRLNKRLREMHEWIILMFFLFRNNICSICNV